MVRCANEPAVGLLRELPPCVRGRERRGLRAAQLLLNSMLMALSRGGWEVRGAAGIYCGLSVGGGGSSERGLQGSTTGVKRLLLDSRSHL